MTPGLVYAAGTVIAWTGWVFAFRAVYALFQIAFNSPGTDRDRLFKGLGIWALIGAIGILVGVYVGKDIDENLFRKIMAGIIIITVIIMLLMEARKSFKVPANALFVSTTGLAAGFTTMLGNLAGAFSNIYFLALRMPKNGFIGTAAWVFLVINLFKLPFQVLVWKNINAASLKVDLVLIPALVLGFWAGIKIVYRIKDDNYRKIVIVLTLIGAAAIFLK